jgi:CubicO group peptidase (beta-lactamase class C family)
MRKTGKIVKILLGTAVLSFILASCATMPKRAEDLAPDDYGFTREYITWLIKKEMKQRGVTGLSIALVDDQRVVWAEGFGLADKANEVAATPETVYRAGSISKLFTATAAMQLAEQGKLDIDKPLQSYLPEFSISSRFKDSSAITPRTIMTHHSGLPSNLSKGMWSTDPQPFETVVEQLKDEYVATPPGYIFSYSNLGVTLLGHALERVAGQSYSSYMSASILSPLGMTYSSFSQGPDHSFLAAKAYRNCKEVDEPALRDIPAGGLNTTVLDLSRFMQMVFAGGRTEKRQIIKSETLAEMLRPQNENVPLDLDNRVGLAWGLGSTDIQNAGPVASHGGATICHRSRLMVLPDHKLGIVVLANSATAGSVVRKVAIETLKLALETKAGIKQLEQQIVDIPHEVTLPYEVLQGYEGRYYTSEGVVDVSNESGYLQAEVKKKPVLLVPRADGLFYLKYRMLGLVPISLGELDKIGISRATIMGREILKARVNGREIIAGERMQPVKVSKKWLQRVGKYEIINQGKDALAIDNFRLRHDDGLLFVEYSMPLFASCTKSLAVEPISDSEVVISGLGRGRGETIRMVNEQGEELLRYSGYLFRKI